VQHWTKAHTKRNSPDSVQEDMMDYYDHDEGERKQMHHSSGAARIYRSGLDEGEDGNGSSEDRDGGSGIADGEDKDGDYDEDEAADLFN